MANGALPQVGEIIIAHEARVEPVSAVRNTVLQSSLALLRDHGYFERYRSGMDAAALSGLESNLAPGWVAMDVAEAHYRACDEMRLGAAEMASLGAGVGQRIRATSVVVAGGGKPSGQVDPWAVAAHLHRAWKRAYQGGSVQISRLGPTDQMIEMRGFSLNRFHYFRHANVAAISGLNAAVGLPLQSTKIVRYDAATHEVAIHLNWK